MVRKNRNLFICEECGFAYKEEQYAKKCEEYCKKYHSCNLEITKHKV